MAGSLLCWFACLLGGVLLAANDALAFTVRASVTANNLLANGIKFSPDGDPGDFLVPNGTTAMAQQAYYVSLPFDTLRVRLVRADQLGNLAFTWERRVRVTKMDGQGRVRSVIAPIWDSGPWNKRDDYWVVDTSARNIYQALTNGVLVKKLPLRVPCWEPPVDRSPAAAGPSFAA